MQPMKIRNNRALAITLLVVGVLLLLTSLAAQRLVGILAGAVLALAGVMMMINPMLNIERGEVQVRNPLGMTLRRFAVSSPADLRMAGNNLQHVPTGKKIAGLGFGADKSDVQRLRYQLPQ
ncbi:hypothetical protein [Georgenia deserti]|uniref:PH domain-containing protein n=1 Tax=Georgenia deserti TaxID=2093781 RepID=A0ABW4L5Y0_9MICO